MMYERYNAPRRYFVDGQGRRLLIGLSLDETTEFEKLDLSPTEAGVTRTGGGSSGRLVAIREARWLELYAKHEEAWRVWIEHSRETQAADLDFVNHRWPKLPA